jgi:hypothetical protein
MSGTTAEPLTQELFRSLTLPELRWIIKDATEAIEVNYASMEIARRNASQGIFRSDPDRFI